MMQSDQKKTSTTYRGEREFGLLVGFVFAAVGSWWLYRDKWMVMANCFLILGAALLLLGAIYPRWLVFPNKAWMALARLLSLVTTPMILAVVYFAILMPTGVIKRLFGWDPLRRRAASADSYWNSYSARQRDPHHFEKMF